MAREDIPSHLLSVYKYEKSSDDLKKKAKKALKAILSQCTNLEALEPLIKDSPPDILCYVLEQFSSVLPNDPVAKKNFVLTGGLKSIQQKASLADPRLKVHIDAINTYYPQEIVQYYSPDYPETLIKKMEEYPGND